MERLTRFTHSRAALWIMIAWYGALGVFASLRTPLYQGADEGWHYAYVEHYALDRGLPNLNAHFLSGDPSAPYWQTHEASQAPLYYMLSSLITRWVPRGDLMQEQVLEGDVPNGMYGNFLPADTGTLGAGHTLAGKLVRLLTVGFGIAVIACGYFIAHLATNRPDVAFLTAALLALNPRMIVLGAAVSNDMPMAAAAAVALLLITRYVTLAAQTWRHAFLIGAFTGVALLMKFNGGVIVAGAGAALLLRAWKHRPNWRAWLGQGLALSAGALLIAGWFFLHNWQAYGDILAWNIVNRMNPGYATPRTVQDLLMWLPFILRSFAAHPGYVLASVQTYNAWNLYVLAAGLLGIVIALARRQFGLAFVPMLAAFLANALAFWSWFSARGSTENMRFFAAVYVPISLALVVGWLALIPRRFHAAASVAGTVAFGGFVTVALVQSFGLMYAFPSYLDGAEREALLARPAASPVAFANGVEMLDVQLKSARVDPGQPIELSIVWRATRPMTASAHLMLDVRDADGKTIAALNTGNAVRYSYIPRAWKIGEPLREDYAITAPAGQAGVVRVLAGWTEHRSNAPVAIVDRPGVSVEIAQVKLRAQKVAPAAATNAMLARFDQLADLIEATPSDGAIRLRWRASAQPSRNVTIFVHGVDAGGAIVVQADVGFDYAAVHWDSGEVFEQTIAVPGLAKAAHIRVGVYDSETVVRAAAFTPAGERWQDDMVIVK